MTENNRQANLFESGMKAFINKDYDASIQNFSQAIEGGDTSYHVWISRGAAYLQINKIRKAISDFNQAIQKNSNHARAYHMRALAYDKLGRPELALADLDFAVKLDPEYGAAFRSRAMIRDKTGRSDEALEDMQTATHLTELQLGRFSVEQNVWQSQHLKLEADEVVSELER